MGPLKSRYTKIIWNKESTGGQQSETVTIETVPHQLNKHVEEYRNTNASKSAELFQPLSVARVRSSAV